MPDFTVDRGHDIHVALSPLPAQISRLHFEGLQDVELEDPLKRFI